MQKRNEASDGWDISDFFIVGVLLGLIAIIVATHCSGVADQENLKVRARKFAQALDLQVISVSCASREAKGDGFIPCTLWYEESAGIIKTMSLECAGETLNYEPGCKRLERGTTNVPKDIP